MTNPRELPDTGSYVPFAVMDDGGVLCRRCIEDPTNPVHNQPDLKDGWQVVGWDHSGNAEDRVVCDHCNETIVEDPGT